MLMPTMLSTSSSFWLMASILARTTPRSGLEREGRASRIVTRTFRMSPGRTGFGHLTSSTPGEARLATCERKWSTYSRIVETDSVPAGGDDPAESAVRRLLWVECENTAGRIALRTR